MKYTFKQWTNDEEGDEITFWDVVVNVGAVALLVLAAIGAGSLFV